MKKNIFAGLICFLVVAGCNQKVQVTSIKDYDIFLEEELVRNEEDKLRVEVSFWKQRLQIDTGSFVSMLKLATWHTQLFKLKGDIDDLTNSDSYLRQSSAKLAHTDPDILFSLSQQSITRHSFQMATKYITQAENSGGDPYISALLQFDAGMELGMFHQAISALQQLKDKTDFHYLVRKSKWEDHKGNLDEAIRLMEQAEEKVRNRIPGLYYWARSNLADMYGHAGRIKESYAAYLEVLKKDPGNLYCLKGIAWIAYSYDHNIPEAKRILRFILSQTNMPDLKIMLAEISGFEGDGEAKKRYLLEFLEEVEKPEYGDMYNKYLIEVYSEEIIDHEKALMLAEKELKNRLTPETWDGLAWVYYKKGDLAKAFEIARGYVWKASFEPVSMMHTGFIFADNGKTRQARELLEECLESSFELGPVLTKGIREKLKTL